MEKEKNKARFSHFGKNLKAARKALGLTQQELAEKTQITTRYLSNIENSGAIPSLPVFAELVIICKLPVDKYFNPDKSENISQQRNRVQNKINLCPEQYLSIIEGALDGALTDTDRSLHHKER